MNQNYEKIKSLNAEVLVLHAECSEPGTIQTVKKHSVAFPMANDDKLRVVEKYGPTSTFLIDSNGVIRARWLDNIQTRVSADEIINALSAIQEKGAK